MRKEERKKEYVIGTALLNREEVPIRVQRVNQTGSEDIHGEFFNIYFGEIPVLNISPAPFRDLEGRTDVLKLDRGSIT